MTDFDNKEYFDYVNNGVSGKLTRGLVVDTKDPLYSGRVKVWIPTLHGGLAPTDSMTGDAGEGESFIGDDLGTDKLGTLTDSAIECLPWAPVMGNNWGPTGDFDSEVAAQVFGVFNIPKIGTEVFIIFEDDNPNLPVVMGCAFHESELIHNARIKSLEITPGTLLSNELTDAEEQEGYPDRVSESYVITSEKGAHLIITDLDGQEQINLGSYINLFKKAVVIDDESPSSKYTQFTLEYPNFPTTASAPFRKRNSVNSENSILDVQVLRTKPAATSSAMPVTQPPAGQPVTEPPAPNPTSPVKVKKNPPIDTAWPKIQKGTYKDFRFDRTVAGKRRIHLGVDLSVTKVNLVAPIDCIPLAYINSETAGKMLLVKGIDGYVHAFLHLDSVLPSIIQDTNSGIYKKYTAGTKLGVTGNTGKVEGAGGGWHLHWEVFHAADLVKTRAEAIQLREILRKPGQGTMKGITIKGENFTHPYNLVHPLEDWLKADTLLDDNGKAVVTEVTMQAAQLDAFSEVYNTSTSSEYNRVIGLEMSLTPGAEHIFIRHPSGGYAGFDADGNWKVYTPGNAEYKVNRNLVFDVLGGVMTNCLAAYTRAKTLIRLMSTVRPSLLTSIGDAFAINTKLPKIFARIESAREKDMADALKQSASNAYYTLEDSMLGKTVADIKKDGYAADFDPSKYPDRNYSVATFDAFIKASHAKHLPASHALAKVLTPSLIKSIMLKESNGNPNARNGSFVGLFQLGASAVKDITKQTVVNMEEYTSPERNVDVGVQYILMCVNIMLSAVKKANMPVTSDEDKRNVLMAALMGYNFGPYAIKNLYANVLNQSNTLSYPALEERFINDNLYTRDKKKGKETLEYAPHIMHMVTSGKVTVSN